MDRLDGWRRVSVHNQCPVCKHNSWCTVAPDGSAIRCKRVESQRPCPGEDGEAWLHVLHEQLRCPRSRPLPMLTPSRPDLAQLALEFKQDASAAWIEQTANRLGVAPEALVGLGAGRDRHGNLAVPMADAEGAIVGIRIRTPSGRKFAVAGGREGVFLHLGVDEFEGPLLFPEGPTSSAAALTLGFEVVGRPSCSGGVKYCRRLGRNHDCVVVADADQPGQRGGLALASALLLVAQSVRVMTPPAKDLREWLKRGARREDVASLISSVSVQRLHVRYRQ